MLGKKIDGVTVFLRSDCEKKADDDLRSFADPDYYTGVTILTLIEPAIDIVNQFVLDPMHLLYLGCTHRIWEKRSFQIIMNLKKLMWLIDIQWQRKVI